MGCCPWARFTHKADKHKQDKEAYLCLWNSRDTAPWLIRFVDLKKVVKGARQDMLGESVLSIDADDVVEDRRGFASCSTAQNCLTHA
jgi:hypothetical protein